MGLLDEAIREHLELKRKRGADPTELTRQEQEALGPAVREPFQRPEPVQQPATADAAHDIGEPADYEPVEPGDYEPIEPADFEPSQAQAARRSSMPPAQPDPEAPPAHHPVPDEGLQPDPEAPTAYHEPAPARDRHEAAGQETVDFDAEQIFAEEDGDAEEEAPGEEDVLEETPEFLQETPEHDRLWFEQRPPRDFDFDG